MMKKIVTVSFLLLLMVGFAACSSDDNTAVDSSYSELKAVLQQTGLFYDISADPDASIIKKVVLDSRPIHKYMATQKLQQGIWVIRPIYIYIR